MLVHETDAEGDAYSEEGGETAKDYAQGDEVAGSVDFGRISLVQVHH